MICTWYFKIVSNLKLRITISKYHSWYLCQISLQIMLLPIQTNIWKKIMIIRSQLFFKNFVIVLSWFISQILWTAIIPLIFHSCHPFLHLPHPHLSPLPLLPQIQLRSTNGTKLTAGSFRGKPWAQIFLIRIQFGKR